MPENDFEKHVQDRMDELKYRPSPAVWNAVELELKKKKKKRVVFFIFLFAGLGLLGYSGYTLFNTTRPVLANQQVNAAAIKKANTGNSSQQSVATPTQALPVKDELKTPVTEIPGNSVAPVIVSQQENKNKIVKTDWNNPETNTIERKPTTIDNSIKKVPVKKSEKAEKISATSLTKNDLLEKKTGAGITENEMDISQRDVEPDVVQEEKAGETIKEDRETIKIDSVVKVVTLPLVTNPVEAKKKRLSKIRLGLDISVGATFSRNKVFPFASSERLADFNYGTPQNSTGNSSGGYLHPPSSIRPGPAYKAGIFADINLSKRSSLSTGLRYVYMSEKLNVGHYTNTPIVSGYSNGFTGGYYQGNPKASFTDEYHFIELPLTYQLKLNRGNKTSVFWNTGISTSYLISATSLLYDTAAGGIYYKALNEITRIHFNLTTGFTIRFGNRSRMPWSVGPDLSFDMSKLLKQDLYTEKRYLLYGGISARIFLPVKKK